MGSAGVMRLGVGTTVRRGRRAVRGGEHPAETGGVDIRSGLELPYGATAHLMGGNSTSTFSRPAFLTFWKQGRSAVSRHVRSLWRAFR